MEYEFNRKRIDKYSTEKILDELKSVSKFYQNKRFGWREFDKVSTISGSVVKNHFKGWNNAILALEKDLGFNLLVQNKKQITEIELFDEMDRIWKELSHRPSRNEWESSSPKFHYNTYKSRFGSWRNANYEFIAFKTQNNNPESSVTNISEKIEVKREHIVKKEMKSRDVTPTLRLKVLIRDNMKCCYCGNSPARNYNIVLHIDHIIPFSKGGKTEFENLQTLCFDCNIGKSDKIILI